jgi:hypothetical protein
MDKVGVYTVPSILRIIIPNWRLVDPIGMGINGKQNVPD